MMNLILKRCTCILALMVVLFFPLQGQGKVYLVLGSDTAIWDGMGVDRYNDTYDLSLYTSPTRNGAKVMDPSFRNGIRDSYGQTVKLTWWMMGGNILRYATNKNIPLPNVMTLYLMKKYYGEQVRAFGDELTMHYHTFVWTDYDKDGIFWWNQAKQFMESAADFDVTLAEYLLEEQTFPVSFRSGWHAMDNDWQHYLDTILPFSMHDDWPAHRVDTLEPLDNTYDWSQSSKEWVPFHPSPTNYQLAGNSKSWNLRSTHIAGVDSSFMATIFAKANAGVDQVACLWGHLPEEDFLDNIAKVGRAAVAASKAFPNVKFRYCSAVEAMQRWRGTTDSIPPVVTITEQRTGSTLKFVIAVNEPLFQPAPYVAMKDLYERYTRVRTVKTGTNQWTTTDAFEVSSIVKIGVAATDTSGNLGMAFLRYLPDDLYIDNGDNAYTEVSGTWSNASKVAWGTDARVAVLGQTDSAKIVWHPTISQSGRYNVFVQVPSISNAAGNTLFRIISNGQVTDTAYFGKSITPGDWIFVATPQLDVAHPPTIEMVVRAAGQAGKSVPVDVLKLSPLVRERQLLASKSTIDFGEVSETDTARVALVLQNQGMGPLTITSFSTHSASVFVMTSLPLVIPPMQAVTVQVGVYAPSRRLVSDTLAILSDDPILPRMTIPVAANILNYFTVVDNEDPVSYHEGGKWYFSVVQAYGLSSRFSNLGDGPGAWARYSTTLKSGGMCDIQIIVPKTVNASTRAKYVVIVSGVPVDSVYVDQNTGSGAWVTVLSRQLPALTPIDVVITDASPTTSSGLVLRADAMRFALQNPATSIERSSPTIPTEYTLEQNYPNPFNPSTRIRFALPRSAHARLSVFDMLGREVAVLFDGQASAGWYTMDFQAGRLSSGVYFYRLESGPAVLTGRMLLLR